MMEKQFAQVFISLVKELIPKEDDREKLFEALRRYQSSQDLWHLISNLRTVLDEPKKLEVFELLRPLILLRHQIPYSQLVPPSPGVRLHVVRLQQQARESLGFAVRGGYEYGVGIFVTHITPGSQADRQGLKVGDQIVRVNGFTISEAIHEDVLRLIKSHDDIVLKVKHIGMIPCQEEGKENVTWKYVDDLQTLKENSENHPNTNVDGKRLRDIKIFIDSTGHASIGCTIISEQGPAVRYHGIFVEKVRLGSLADEVGLKPGDQILEVNNTSFRGITFDEAKLALKSSRQLYFTIRKNSLRVSLIRGSEAGPVEPQTVPVESQVVPQDEPPAQPSPEPLPANDRRSSYDKNYEVQVERAQVHQQVTAQVHVKPTGHERLGGSAQPYPGLQSYSFEQTTSPLGGAAAAKLEQRRLESSNSPSLLELEGEFGWTDKVPQRIYEKFSSEALDGKDLKCLSFRKTSSLGVAVEGGLGSPLGGKIVVSMVFEDGIAHKSGKLKVGDQLMMINERQMVDVTLAEAEDILNSLPNSPRDKTVELIYCESTLVNDEDSVTYF